MKYSFFLLLLVFFGCERSTESSRGASLATTSNLYAENFNIQKEANYTVITIKNAWEGHATPEKYVLYEGEPPTGITEAHLIPLPISRVVCMSTTHLAMMSALGLEDLVVGVASPVYHPTIAQKITEGKVKMLGDGGAINYELLLDLEPDLVFNFGVADASTHQKMQSLGIKSVLIAEFRDKTPLARCEWLKVFGAFLGKETEANALFNDVDSAYQATQKRVLDVTQKPTVFMGIPFQGVWYMPSAESFEAAYIKDAGGDFLWKNAQNVMSLSLDFEAVFEKAHGADKWLNVGYVFSKNALEERDKRFAQFEAFQTGEMYNYTARVSENGSFDIYESAVVRPHIVLKDYMKALHPSLMTDHDFYYYEKMTAEE